MWDCGLPAGRCHSVARLGSGQFRGAGSDLGLIAKRGGGVWPGSACGWGWDCARTRRGVAVLARFQVFPGAGPRQAGFLPAGGYAGLMPRRQPRWMLQASMAWRSSPPALGRPRMEIRRIPVCSLRSAKPPSDTGARLRRLRGEPCLARSSRTTGRWSGRTAAHRTPSAGPVRRAGRRGPSPPSAAVGGPPRSHPNGGPSRRGSGRPVRPVMWPGHPDGNYRPSVSMTSAANSPPLKFCWPVMRLPSRTANPRHRPAWM